MCGCLNSLREQDWHFPFEQPVGIDMKTMQFKVGEWGVTLHHKTKAGKRSSAGSKFLLLNYCPICGKDLRKKEDEPDTRIEEMQAEDQRAEELHKLEAQQDVERWQDENGG